MTGRTSAVRWRDGDLVVGDSDAPVRALLFDLGGTLDADGLGWGERFAALLEAELPGAPDPTRLGAALEAGEKAVLARADAASLGLEEMVAVHVRAQMERLGVSDSGPAARIAKRFHEETARALAARRGLLARLSARLPLGVVSNGCGNSERILAEAGLADVFRVVVDSARVNAWKPDPRIFAPALAALGVPARSVAMVGDRLDRDVEGAAAAGLRAVLVTGRRAMDARAPLAASVDAAIGSVEALDPEPAHGDGDPR